MLFGLCIKVSSEIIWKEIYDQLPESNYKEAVCPDKKKFSIIFQAAKVYSFINKSYPGTLDNLFPVLFSSLLIKIGEQII